jgi:hypothetical protein
LADEKTAKNRAKRRKRMERAKRKGPPTDERPAGIDVEAHGSETPIKKRRLVSGKEMVFKKPGEEGDDEEVGSDHSVQAPEELQAEVTVSLAPVVDKPKITIHEED